MATHIFVLNLFILLPIIVWLYRIFDYAVEYNVFGVVLVFGFINEVIQFTANTSIAYQISSSIYYLVETELLLFILLCRTRLKLAFKIACHLVFILMFSVNFYSNFGSTGTPVYWGYMLALIILVFFGIGILTNTQLKTELSKKLIIISFLVFAIYYILLNILMKYLYTKETRELFINLYNTITLINVLSYISYSFAFKWAPKKEKYL